MITMALSHLVRLPLRTHLKRPHAPEISAQGPAACDLRRQALRIFSKRNREGHRSGVPAAHLSRFRRTRESAGGLQQSDGSDRIRA